MKLLIISAIAFGVALPSYSQGKGDPGKFSTTPDNPECRFFDGFFDNGNGTVTDPRNGLVWKLCDEGFSWDSSAKSCNSSDPSAVFFTWSGAVDVANSSSFLGRKWRLPTSKEYQMISGDWDSCQNNNWQKMQSAVSPKLFHQTYIFGGYDIRSEKSIPASGTSYGRYWTINVASEQMYSDRKKYITHDALSGSRSLEFDKGMPSLKVKLVEKTSEYEKISQIQERRRAEKERMDQAREVEISCNGYYPGMVGVVRFRYKLLATSDKFIVRYVNTDRKMVTIEGLSDGNSLRKGETHELSCISLKKYEQ